MNEILVVGKLFREGVRGRQEGPIFDYDGAFNLTIYLKTPNKNEIDAIRNEKIKVGYYIKDEVIFMLFKFGAMAWMDTPYSIHLSKGETNIYDVTDVEGLALVVCLVDARTGILNVMRLVALPTAFSRKLKIVVEKQRAMPFIKENYNQTIQEIYMNYPTKKLVDYADIVCNV